jgi:hypothetical protein
MEVFAETYRNFYGMGFILIRSKGKRYSKAMEEWKKFFAMGAKKEVKYA